MKYRATTSAKDKQPHTTEQPFTLYLDRKIPSIPTPSIGQTNGLSGKSTVRPFASWKRATHMDSSRKLHVNSRSAHGVAVILVTHKEPSTGRAVPQTTVKVLSPWLSNLHLSSTIPPERNTATATCPVLGAALLPREVRSTQTPAPRVAPTPTPHKSHQHLPAATRSPSKAHTAAKKARTPLPLSTHGSLNPPHSVLQLSQTPTILDFRPGGPSLATARSFLLKVRPQ